jgi:hypothetical protein
MDTVIERLRDKVANAPAGDRESWETFDLLAAACSYCCTQYTGGNETCPPKVAISA